MKKVHFTKTEWALLLGAVLFLIFLLSGCGHRPTFPGIGGNTKALFGSGPALGKIATSATPSSNAEQNKKDQDEARAQAEFWTCRVKVEEDQGKRLVAAERQHWLEVTCRWLMGMCVFGMIASGFAFAASFIWPWFERLRYAAIAGVGASVVIFCIGWYLPTQIFWIGIGIAACTVAGIIILFQHSHVIGKAEFLLHKDLNGDGSIGYATTQRFTKKD